MLIWIASYPRSGNTWLRIVLYYLCGYPSWSRYLRPRPSTSPWSLGQLDLAGASAQIESPELVWVKTHERAERDAHPAVYVVRDGRDTLVSYAWFTLNFERALPDPIDPQLFRKTLYDLMVGDSPFGTWSENVRSWLRRPNTVVVKFEDLLRDPHAELRRATAGLGLENVAIRENVKLPTFAELHAAKPTFFRQGTSGQWRTDMPPDLLARFWETQGSAMAELGYE